MRLNDMPGGVKSLGLFDEVPQSMMFGRMQSLSLPCMQPIGQQPSLSTQLEITLPPRHCPAWQVVPLVQPSRSLQAWPWFAGTGLQTPLMSQTPSLQSSVASAHAPPGGTTCCTHCPLGIEQTP